MSLQISDQKCPLPMPPSSEPCDIPNCDGTNKADSPRLDARRQVRPKDKTDLFRDGPVISLASNTLENEVTPVLSTNYSFSAAGGWLYTEWSEVSLFAYYYTLIQHSSPERDGLIIF